MRLSVRAWPISLPLLNVFDHILGTESGNHGLGTLDYVFGEYGKTLEETGELGIGDVDLAGTSHPFRGDD